MSKGTEKAVKEKSAEERKPLGAVVVMCLSLVLGGIAALMIFVPGIQLLYVSYAVCAVLVITGICMIVRYFMADTYRNVNEYGFSLGVLCVILGICGMIRAKALTDSILVVLGIALIFGGVILLQNSLDLIRMKDFMGYLLLVLAIAGLLCGTMVVLRPFATIDFYQANVWYAVFVMAIVVLLFTLYLMLRIRLYDRSEDKRKAKAEEEARKAALEAEKEAERQREQEKREAAAEQEDLPIGAEIAPKDDTSDPGTVEVGQEDGTSFGGSSADETGDDEPERAPSEADRISSIEDDEEIKKAMAAIDSLNG